jgi:hypothetical protein
MKGAASKGAAATRAASRAKAKAASDDASGDGGPWAAGAKLLVEPRSLVLLRAARGK